MIDMIGIYIPFKTNVLSLTAQDELLTKANLIDKTTRYRVSNILDICKADGLKANGYDIQITDNRLQYWQWRDKTKNDTPKKSRRRKMPDFFQQVSVSGLNVPYESLPSSLSGCALKVNHAPTIGIPHIQIKASPAKLAQGHNVWGWDDLTHGVHLILDTLLKACPTLSDNLNFAAAEIRMIDINYSFRMNSKSEVMAVLQYLKSVSYGQTKSRKSEHDTVYFGSGDSKHKFIRMYYKLLELQQKGKSKKLQLIDGINATQLELLSDEYILKYAENLLRIEAAIRKEWIVKRFGSCHLVSVLSQCRSGQVSQMWVDAMSDIAKAVGDVTFKNKSDDEIRELLNDAYHTITKSGKVSYSVSNSIYAFYRLIVSEGFERVKGTYAHNTFYRRLKQLEDVGIPRAHLQQYEDGFADTRSIIPFVKIIDLSNVVHPPVPMPDYKQLCDPKNLDYIDRLFKIA